MTEATRFRGRAEDAYRPAVRYGEEEWRAIHVRDDPVTIDLEDAVPAVHERVTDSRAVLREEDYPPLGAPEATIEVYENG